MRPVTTQYFTAAARSSAARGVRFPTTLAGVAAVLVSASAGCGGATPPPAEPTPSAPAAARAPAPGTRLGMSVSAELGEIDARAAEQAFQAVQADLANCLKKGMRRVDTLSGDAAFFLRIGTDGHPRYAYLEESTLGDRETEKCMLSAVTRAPWPKPQGGEAEVRKRVGFDASPDVRAPTAWNADRVAAALGHDAGKLDECKAAAPGKYAVTAYVEPDGKAGKVVAVGVAPPSKEGEAKVDCIIDAVRAWKLPSPGSYTAKVTFTY